MTPIKFHYEEAPEWMFLKEVKPVDTHDKIIRRIEDIGEAKQLLTKAMQHELFYDIGKYSERWKHKDGVVSELLDDTRKKLMDLEDLLIEMHEVLHKEYDEQ